MKLTTKDSKSTNSNKFAIIEQPAMRAIGHKKPGEKLKVELTGEMQYIVYHLTTSGVIDNNIVFQDYFRTLEETKAKYPDVEVIKWEDVPK